MPLQLELFESIETKKYKIIDLFAGIGGIRLGFEKAFNDNASFVFSSEIDKYAKITYQENFGEIPFGDITQISPNEISSFDILLTSLFFKEKVK